MNLFWKIYLRYYLKYDLLIVLLCAAVAAYFLL